MSRRIHEPSEPAADDAREANDGSGVDRASRRLVRLAEWAVGLLVCLLAWRLAALQLNATDLFFDEAQYWSWSREPAFGYYSKPPLIAWLIGLATGLCGDGEACVRAASPILHTVTALVVMALGRTLYGATVGALAGLTYATLPGVSFSAGIISTDVPLLLAWAVALLAYAAMLRSAARWPAAVLGIALGLGLNAKYAMVYFLLGAAVHMALVPAARQLLRDARWWLALALGAALIAPNLYWNYANSFATFAHTADNVNLGGRLFRPGRALEFTAAQFGVFGPILLAALTAFLWRARAEPVGERERFLLAFSLPIILLIIGQAFLSRAHANWAAVAYVAASVLVPAVLWQRPAERRWLGASLALNAGIALAIGLVTWQAGRFTLPGGADPFARTLGWQGVADVTRKALATARREGHPFDAVLTDDRAVTAELLYYMRGEPTPVLAWRGPGRPRDHYALTRAYTPDKGERVLLVSLEADSRAIERTFVGVIPLATETVPAGRGPPRKVRLLALRGPAR
jgi:4-amino-4-deoxy-L-arabinose transferase-like glycosyltransferase